MPARLRWSLVALPLLALFILVLPACGGEEAEEASGEAVEARTAVYETRGIVQSLPAEGEPASEFRVRHEAIPDFRPTWTSDDLGMNAMVMPFPPREGVSIESLSIGDIVRLRFEVRYDAATGQITGYEATEITKLPPETELEFGASRGEGSEGGAAPDPEDG